MACPPLHNLLRALSLDPVMVAAVGRVKAPMLDAMLKFVTEFNLLEHNNSSGAKGHKKEKNKSRRGDIVTGLGLEPSVVFNMLLQLETDTFKVMEFFTQLCKYIVNIPRWWKVGKRMRRSSSPVC